MDPDDPFETTIAGYDRLAADPDAIPWGATDYQRHYVWPSVRPLVPDVEGARVLDAGCGIGDYVGWFLDEGATVVGVDASERALDRARDRFGDRARFHHCDLTAGLDFADDGTFDFVFCNLVLDHVEDWDPVVSAFHRVLRRRGRFVFTTIHPMRRFLRYRDELTSYYETEGYARNWGEGATIVSYHRPMEEIVHVLTENGFRVDVFREAEPPAAFRDSDPDRYERASQRPDLLCVRAVAGDAG